MTEPGRRAVAITDLSKIFNEGKPNEVHALEDINLSIDEGSFVSLIGPSGCGKSTLLRLMGALTHPTTGEVSVNHKSADQARLDRDYGMAFQASALFKWRTVTENVELPLQLMSWSKAERKESDGDAQPRQTWRVRRSLPIRTFRWNETASGNSKGALIQALAPAHG